MVSGVNVVQSTAMRMAVCAKGASIVSGLVQGLTCAVLFEFISALTRAQRAAQLMHAPIWQSFGTHSPGKCKARAETSEHDLSLARRHLNARELLRALHDDYHGNSSCKQRQQL